MSVTGDEMMDRHEIAVHASHCCPRHGCKYADTDCPIVLGRAGMRYGYGQCEQCSEIDEHVENARLRVSEGDHLNCWGCGRSVEVATRGTGRPELVLLPHTYGSGIGAGLRCGKSSMRVDDGCGNLRPLFAGAVGGVTVQDVFSALEDITAEVYGDLNGDTRTEIEGRDDVADAVLVLLRRVAASR